VIVGVVVAFLTVAAAWKEVMIGCLVLHIDFLRLRATRTNPELFVQSLEKMPT
jgi:hypothetical protein